VGCENSPGGPVSFIARYVVSTATSNDSAPWGRCRFYAAHRPYTPAIVDSSRWSDLHNKKPNSSEARVGLVADLQVLGSLRLTKQTCCGGDSGRSSKRPQQLSSKTLHLVHIQRAKARSILGFCALAGWAARRACAVDAGCLPVDGDLGRLAGREKHGSQDGDDEFHKRDERAHAFTCLRGQRIRITSETTHRHNTVFARNLSKIIAAVGWM